MSAPSAERAHLRIPGDAPGNARVRGAPRGSPPEPWLLFPEEHERIMQTSVKGPLPHGALKNP
jgi:hypothetical protein